MSQIVVGIWLSPGSARYTKFKRVTLSSEVNNWQRPANENAALYVAPREHLIRPVISQA